MMDAAIDKIRKSFKDRWYKSVKPKELKVSGAPPEAYDGQDPY